MVHLEKKIEIKIVRSHEEAKAHRFIWQNALTLWNFFFLRHHGPFEELQSLSAS